MTALLLLLVLAASLAALKQGPVAPMSPLLLDLGILLQLVVEAIFAAIVLAVLPALSKFSLRQLGFRLPSAANVGTAILGAVGMVIVANGGASLIDYLLHSQHQQDIVQIFRALHDHTTIVIFAVFAVVFAPFAEETFFRIFFFNLGLRYSGFWGGAVLSGLLFGIAHGDAYAALPLALGGIVLCAVYYRTRNAWAPMISHALFNSVSIVALLFIPKVSQ
ncbi:MAG: CPBP family intramembrane metalloprotease [Candidatus Eremiobacteraeota bacterium]|nr:CPBP family intramembrane metalloprotease [Candidatus Eremiobacteraeota bacterium]